MNIVEKFSFEEVQGFKFGIDRPGIPTMFSHIYLIDGLVIDTGHSNMQKQIVSALQQEHIEKVFITHHHEDHTGNIEALKRNKPLDFFASKACCEIMKNPPKLSFAQKLIWGSRKPYSGLIPIKDEIQSNRYSFRLIPVTGHADDMMALYEPSKKWLFSADVYVNSFIGYYLSTESMQKQIQATKKILDLDFDVMFCAHNPQLKNGKAKLQKKLHFLENFFESVKLEYQKGKSAKEIFKALKLKEMWLVKILSMGDLSTLNMVRSVIRDLEQV